MPYLNIYSIERILQPKHEVRHLNQRSMPTKTPSTPTKTPKILLPNIDLRCFVAKHFLSQIYALFWCTFYRPRKCVGVQKMTNMRYGDRLDIQKTGSALLQQIMTVCPCHLVWISIQNIGELTFYSSAFVTGDIRQAVGSVRKSRELFLEGQLYQQPERCPDTN